ncbi:MAG: ABC transporter permease [Ignavibacteria bacterium]|jgi:ABC-2 type transport system permease protein|nr:ABC transporter permease [Ignavibacteria bacterium]
MQLLIQFIKKELIQFRRDPKMFAVVLVLPVLQLILLGYAANFDLNTVHTAVLDRDRTESSRDFIQLFEKSGYFNIDYNVSSYEELTDLLDKGKVLTAIVIPIEYEKKINSNQTANVQLIFDGSDGNKAAIAAGYSAGIVSGYAQNLLLERAERTGRKTTIIGTINPEVRIWYNPNLTTRNYMLPGIVGLIILIVTTSLTSLAIVKEREVGTLEQLIVTPVKPYQMILGKFIPFIIIGFVSCTIVLTVMRFWFGIEVRGSIAFLFLCTFVYMLSTLGLGLFVSTISKTQQQAMMTSAFGVLLPMLFFSGFIFPIENMPKIVQYITYAIPLKYYITMIRGIVLKGNGIADLWQDLIILFGIGVLILGLSSLRFNKKLE